MPLKRHRMKQIIERYIPNLLFFFPGKGWVDTICQLIGFLSGFSSASLSRIKFQ